MKSIKKLLVSKSMRVMGFFSLLLGVLAVSPNSTLLAHQRKCPDELLK